MHLQERAFALRLWLKNVEGKTEGSPPPSTDWADFTPNYRYEGRAVKLHVTTGLRLGYRFNL